MTNGKGGNNSNADSFITSLKVITALLTAITALILVLDQVKFFERFDDKKSQVSRVDSIPETIEEGITSNVVDRETNLKKQGSGITEEERLVEIRIREVIRDATGSGVGSVMVWCSNCKNKSIFVSNLDGEIVLVDEFVVQTNPSLEKVRICMQFKEINDCVNQSLSYMSIFKFPVINRK